jgi:hypothetical protein
MESSPTYIYFINKILSSFHSIQYREKENKKQETMARAVPYPGLSNYSVPQAKAYYSTQLPDAKHRI